LGTVPAAPADAVTNESNQMKSILTAFFGVSLAFAVGAAEESPFKSPTEKNSYAVGLMIGKQLKKMGAEIDGETYLKGLKDGMSGAKTPFADDAQMQEAVRAAQMEWQGNSKKEGEKFLAENKKKEGVVTTPSGLQYKIETKGTGKIPTSNDTVVCHYRGTLMDGTEFDSSYKRSEPSSFPVTGVIKGWTEALVMMPVGSKWKLTIPSDLAYGERGRPSIPPNSVLQFDIELISIQEPGAAGTPGAPGVTGLPGGAAPRIQVNPPKPATPPNPK